MRVKQCPISTSPFRRVYGSLPPLDKDTWERFNHLFDTASEKLLRDQIRFYWKKAYTLLDRAIYLEHKNAELKQQLARLRSKHQALKEQTNQKQHQLLH